MVNFAEREGSSSDEQNINEEEKTKPNDEVQIDAKLNDFFKVCISKCFNARNYS